MPRQGGYSVQHTGQARAAGQLRKIIKSGLATLGKERATCVYFPTAPGPLSITNLYMWPSNPIKDAINKFEMQCQISNPEDQISAAWKPRCVNLLFIKLK
jgi:hypothetical protein